MGPLDVLMKRVKELKEKGLNEREIAEELNLSETTVTWLLSGAFSENIPVDVRIGWRSIGVYPKRIRKVAEIMADIIQEECNKLGERPDSVVGIATNGTVLATLVADILGLELIVYRPITKVGHFASNYANPRRKRVVIVDDIFDTGGTVEKAIRDLREEGARPLLVVVLVNKTHKDTIQEVPLRALIRTVTLRS